MLSCYFFTFSSGSIPLQHIFHADSDRDVLPVYFDQCCVQGRELDAHSSHARIPLLVDFGQEIFVVAFGCSSYLRIYHLSFVVFLCHMF